MMDGRYGEKLHFDLFRDLTRTTVFDVSMKARCSVGLEVTKYLGGFGERNGWSLELPTMDADKTVSFGLKYEGSLKPETSAQLQFAVLFTTASGERKIRVFNYTLAVVDKLSIIALPCKSRIDLVYAGLDVEAIINLEAKQYIAYMLKTTIRAAKEQMCLTCINVLAYYRTQISGSSVSGQFVLPETLNNYPLFLLGTLKSAAFAAWEDVSLDAKIFQLCELSYCSLSQFVFRIYARMYSLSQAMDSPEHWGGVTEQGSIVKPVNIPTSYNSMLPGDAYMIVNADCIYFYLPATTDPKILQEVKYSEGDE